MFTFTPSEELLDRWVRATDQPIKQEEGCQSFHIRVLNESREQDREMLTRDIRRYLATLGFHGGTAGKRIATRSFELLPEVVHGLEERFGYDLAPEAQEITRLFARDMYDAIHRDARITPEIYVQSHADGYYIYGPHDHARPRPSPQGVIIE